MKNARVGRERSQETRERTDNAPAKAPTVKFGRYEVHKELGRGSMGVVYQARDPVIGREVAIKSIPETFGLATGKRQEFVQRLRQEATTAGRLSHPNIVTIFDVGETADGPFIAMEYLDGITLRDVISAGKKVSMTQLVEIVAQIAEGLDYAHSQKIIHRDIKPANLMIVGDNRVKIMDLGIAKLPMSELTKDGKLVGSPSYMAPEQLTGKKIDHRADLFSLGVSIYQLMTLKKPFPGDAINEICYKIVHDDFTPPRRLNVDLPIGFDDFMRVALAKDPENRFQNGAEMVQALAAVVSGAYEEEGLEDEPSLEDDSQASSLLTGIEKRADRSNPESGDHTFGQTSTIDDIFKDLTLTARIVDLSRQNPRKFGPNWPLIATVGAIAATVAALLIYLIAR